MFEMLPPPRRTRRKPSCPRQFDEFHDHRHLTIMTRPSVELLREVFPGVALTHEIGEFETLLAIDKARETTGYEPKYSWRDHVASPSGG